MCLSRYLCVLALLLTFLTVGCDVDDFVKNDTYATPMTFSESAIHIDGVVVDNHNGDVVVTTHSRSTIDISAEKYVTARSREDAREFIDDLDVKVIDDSGRLRIETRLPRSTPSSVGEIGVDYEIRLPSQMDIEVSSTDGDVVVVGVTGKLDIATTNGRITLESVRGTIDASNVNGDIKLRQVDGEVRANSTNGELLIEILSHTVRCDARTNNGDITIYIPQDASTEGNLRTVNGDIRSDFAMEYPASSGRFYLELGSGQGELEAWTNNGDIELRSLGRTTSSQRKR